MEFLKPLAVFLWCIAQCAVAQPPGAMVNISASGEVDPGRSLVQIACAMVEDSVPLAIFAEALTADTDPGLLLLHFGSDGAQKIAENNDYTSLPPEDLRVLNQRLRLPNHSTDAALLGTTSDAVLCAVGFEVREDGPPGRINISINDLVRVTAFAPAPDKTAVKITAVHAADAPIDAAVTAEAIEVALKRLNRR
jgi:hypothetical protein